jgi:glycosyltransferase involved in cell wall biosynthesis
MPKVSVIIPTYNAEKYIKDAIDSVLKQTFQDFEIIIVDDCSTDNTEKIIFENYKKEIENGKIKFLKNEKNYCRTFTANRGVKEAKGEYIFFLDADDVWKENHIELLLKEIQKPDVDIVYTLPRIFIDENGKVKRISKKKIEKDIDKIIFSSRIGFPSATAFKKKNFIYYDSECKYRGDIELLIRARLNGQKIKIVDTNTVMIREHNAPHRMSKTENFYKYTLRLYQLYMNKVPKKYRKYFLFHVGEIAFRFGDLGTGWKMVFKAVKENPLVLLDKYFLFSLLKRGFRIDRFIKRKIALSKA